MDQFEELIKHVLDKGVKKSDRTGVGTLSVFGYQTRFDLKDGFPIVTTKRTAFKAATTELIWMIGGWMKLPEYEGVQRTNIKFLIDNNVKIWTEWPYKAYLEYCNALTEPDVQVLWEDLENNCLRPATQMEFEFLIKHNKSFAIQFGNLGPVYQKQWREFEGKKNTVDQLKIMIDRLKTNPDCRRNLTSYWNPTELNEMLLAPCHLLHQVWTRELSWEERVKWVMCNREIALENLAITEEAMSERTPSRAISLQMYQRSSDCFLGVPFDWVFYSLLTHVLGELCNMVPDEFIWVSGDTHLYTNQIEASKEVLTREPFPYPELDINRSVDSIEDYVVADFELIDYQYHPAIKVAVAV